MKALETFLACSAVQPPPLPLPKQPTDATYPDVEGGSTSTSIPDLVRGEGAGDFPGLLGGLHGNGSGVELRDLPHHRFAARLRHQRLARPPLLHSGTRKWVQQERTLSHVSAASF